MPHDLPVQAGFFKQLTQRSVCWCLILFDATARQYRVTEPVFDSMDDQKLAIDKTDAGGTLFRGHRTTVTGRELAAIQKARLSADDRCHAPVAGVRCRARVWARR